MTTAPEEVSLDVRRLSGSLGAEVRGLSLAAATRADAGRDPQAAHGAPSPVLPDQHPSPDHHLAFGRLFGGSKAHPNLDMERERPEFFELRANDGAGGVADEWHSDITFEPHPSKFAILHMKVCPDVGGDTLWANAYKAYDELSAPMRALCNGLTALHDASPHLVPEKIHIHPVVRVHPETGRRSLFVNEHLTRRIVELSDAESTMLLAYPVPVDPPAPLHRPVPVDSGTLAVGQPVHPAPRVERLRGRAGHPAGDGDGRRPRGRSSVAVAALRIGKRLRSGATPRCGNRSTVRRDTEPDVPSAT